MKKTVKTEVIRVDAKKPDNAIILKAASLIRNGEVIAFPTETVYGLGANALDPLSVSKIYRIKGRPSDNPLIVHIADMKTFRALVSEIPSTANKIIKKFWPGPITLVLRKSKILPKITTGGLSTVAIRMPRNKIALELIKKSGCPIAAPSANISGKPSPTNARHVKEDLNGKIQLILDGGNTEIGIESTVIDMTRHTPVILRPGGISKEDIEGEIGNVYLHNSLVGLRKHKGKINKSPGMKYMHYSPNAQVILVEGSELNADNKVAELTNKLKSEGKKVCVMTTNKSLKVNADMVQYMGTTLEAIARNLFGNLRKADKNSIDVIIVEGTQYNNSGFAIMNRLKKAAITIIKV
ncbi:MAG TPA: L-threonylcarbamoyladenylate synthase [Nitrososphaeraceae archaeon]|jgi:L-threonylcarbamoyladenylate synthase